MRVQYADAKSGETNAMLLPSLKFGGAYTRLSSVPSFVVNLPLPPPAPSHFVLSPAILDNYNLRVTVQQPLFTGWKIRSAVDDFPLVAIGGTKPDDIASLLDSGADSVALIGALYHGNDGIGTRFEYLRSLADRINNVANG